MDDFKIQLKGESLESIVKSCRQWGVKEIRIGNFHIIFSHGESTSQVQRPNSAARESLEKEAAKLEEWYNQSPPSKP